MSKSSANKRSVLDERFLKCGECNERFWDNSKLIKHMESHAENKLLLCTICNKTFSAVQDLDKHYLLHRQLMQPYGCPACESRFVTQQQLMSHVDKIHPELTIGDKVEGKSKPPETTASRRNSPRKNLVNIECQKSVQQNVGRTPAQLEKGKSPNVKEVSSNNSAQPTVKKLVLRRVKSLVQPEKDKGESPKGAESSNQAQSSPKKSILTIVKSLTQSPNVAEKLSKGLTQSTIKKSILKVVPTPSGKKRPVIWKDPVVSPEKDLRRNIISVQYKQSPGEKRKLVSAQLDSPGPKKLKIISSETAGGNAATVKFATAVRKTTIGKTKLMQSISDMYDNKTPNEKKSMAQTRKDLLNALTITPVTKGPIRVLKNVKPFIIYSPNKDTTPDRSSISADVSKRTIIVHNSSAPSGNVVQLNEGKQNLKAVGVTSQDFDKLLTSSKPSPSAVKAPLSTKMLQVSFDNLTKKQIPRSSVSTIQLIPVPHIKTPQQPSKPDLTIQATSTGITKNTNSEKLIKNVIQCSVASPSGNAKLPESIFPSCKIPHGLKIIPQSSFKPAQSPVSNKILPLNNSTETSSVKLMRNPKLPITKNLPTQKIIVSQPESQFISEREVHRYPSVKGQKLQILLPSITLKRFSDAEFKDDTAESLAKTVSKNIIEANDVKKASELLSDKSSSIEKPGTVILGAARGSERLSDKSSNIKKQGIVILGAARGSERLSDKSSNIKNKGIVILGAARGSERLSDKSSNIKKQGTVILGAARGVKRRGKIQSTEDSSVNKQAKLKIASAGGVKKADSVEEQSTLKHTVNDNKIQNKLPSTEGSSVQDQAMLKFTKTLGAETQLKLQFAVINNTKDAKELSPFASNVNKQAHLSPKSATRNAAYSKSELVKEEPVDNSVAEKVNENVIRRSNRYGPQVTKPEVPIPAVKNDTVPAIRRSARTLAKKADNKSSPKGLKIFIQQKKALKKTKVKKNILKKVIEKEVTAIENVENKTDNDLGDSNKTVAAPPTVPQTPVQNKIRVVTLTPAVMKKLKDTVLKKTSSTTPNHIRLVVPSEVLCRIQNSAARNQNVETPGASKNGSSNLNVSVVPAPAKIIRYGLEDLKRDQQRRKEEKEKMAEKEKILKKMLVKFDEKEKKKQLKFCEKKLTRFLDKHRESHLEKLEEKLLSVRNLTLEDGIQLLDDVKHLGCRKCKEVIGKTLCSLGFGNEKDLFGDKAVEGLISLSTAKAKKRQDSKKANIVPAALEEVRKKRPYNKRSQAATKIQQSPKKFVKVSPKKESPSKPDKTGFTIIECAPNKGGLSYSNVDGKKSRNLKRKAVPTKAKPIRTIKRRTPQRKPKQSKALVDDPFVDVSIITEEKFVIECPCMKPNCDGLHPENFLI